ncbi:hypothetical protein B0T20DRAFT_388616 [Sordaria brevicollis]|uniref:Uncharacterized protein n=1 Tax=Sordaria brevicollis TaxID=83679 RepID=A0AAE0UG89_SORBR|nr:hypothetical protein B0T20DRAFT_388616 [Sordaria brevicollis]
MSSNISQWLNAVEISPVLLDLNFTTLGSIPDCEIAGKFSAEFERLLKNKTTALPLPSLVYSLHSYSSINLTNVTLGQLRGWLTAITSTYLDHSEYRNETRNGAIFVATGSFFVDIRSQCTEEYCRNVEWRGDPDLCGIGVSYSPLGDCSWTARK